MTTDEFDAQFDAEQDVTAALDVHAARRPGREQRRVNIDFPEWMVGALDQEAARLGVTRQSVIKMWLAERLDRQNHPAS